MIEGIVERSTADALRKASGLYSKLRLPEVGDIVEVTKSGSAPRLGICTGYEKGWCYVRALDDEGHLTVWLDFISDEARHGPREVTFRIRDDLAD